MARWLAPVLLLGWVWFGRSLCAGAASGIGHCTGDAIAQL